MRLPERINFSIGHRCFVSCPGCYTFFGTHPASLSRFAESMARFVELGVARVTLSGGDPLAIPGLCEFIRNLRQGGVATIKVDTVGTPWVDPIGTTRSAAPLDDLLECVDVLAVPLDGWSNESALAFRKGRPRLFDETCLLLRMLDARAGRTRVFVNTVAHRLNAHHLLKLWRILASHEAIAHWNIFQYTPTDQAGAAVNERLGLTGQEFTAIRTRLLPHIVQASRFVVEFASTRERLGRYLLVNSDGRAWFPDAGGRTIDLGHIFRREEAVLHAWSDAVDSAVDDTSRYSPGPIAAIQVSRHDAALPGLRA
jgi:MoaA/NifB/PqqE/SkfB family radical SAM enzyme